MTTQIIEDLISTSQLSEVKKKKYLHFIQTLKENPIINNKELKSILFLQSNPQSATAELSRLKKEIVTFCDFHDVKIKFIKNKIIFENEMGNAKLDNENIIMDIDAQKQSNVFNIFVSYKHGLDKKDKEALKSFFKYLKTSIKTYQGNKQNILLLDDDLEYNKSRNIQLKEYISKADLILYIINQDYINRISDDGQNDIKEFEYPAKKEKQFILINFNKFLDNYKIAKQLFDDRIFFALEQKSFCELNIKEKINFTNLLTKEINKYHNLSKNINKCKIETVAKELDKLEVKNDMQIDIEVLQKNQKNQIDTMDIGEKNKVIQIIYNWLKDKNKPPLIAFLGETGAGKTTSMKYFTNKERKEKKSNYIPIYLDLRKATKEHYKNIQEFIKDVLTNQTDVHVSDVDNHIKEIITNINSCKACIVFDGIDERAVHMDKTQRVAFMHQIWSLIPSAKLKQWREYCTSLANLEEYKKYNKETNTPQPKLLDPPAKMPKIIITCRTQFFKDLIEEEGYLFTDNYRNDMRKEDFEIYNLLPLKKEQILAYFKKKFIYRDNIEMYKNISSIYNLAEMCKRPLLLDMITSIDDVFLKYANKKKVYTIDIYQEITKKWLNRDNPKHIYESEYKDIIMQELAYEIWSTKKREISGDDIGLWHDKLFNSNNLLKDNYSNHSKDALKTDMRNSTFISRDAGSDKFRFAHTSILEYFLAKYLLDKTKKILSKQDDIKEIFLYKTSEETFSFLSQLIIKSEEEFKVNLSNALLKLLINNKNIELKTKIFKWLIQTSNLYDKFPFVYQNFCLKDTMLDGVKINSKIHLQNIDFSNASLENMHIKDVHIKNCNFTNANMRKSIFENCVFNNSIFDSCDMSFVNINKCEFDNNNFDNSNFNSLEAQNSVFKQNQLISNAKFYQSVFINCNEIDIKNKELTQIKPKMQKQILKRLFLDGGHKNGVNSVCFSPDGKQMLSGSGDNSIKLFDAKNYKLLHTFKQHNNAVYSVCFSPDGKQILSSSDDNSIKLFDVKNYKLLHTFNEHTSGVNSVCFSPDGKQILSGSQDNSIKLFDVKNYKLLHTFNEHKNGVLSVCFSPDGKQILSSSYDNSIKLFDAKNYKLLHTFKQHNNAVYSVCFSPDGKQILSSSDDNSIKLFDVKNYKLLHTFNEHTSGVNSVCFSPDGKQILSGSDDNSIKLFDAKNYKLLHTFNEHKNGVNSVCFSPDGKQILSGSFDNSIKLFDAKNYKLLHTFNEHTSGVLSVCFSPDGKQILSGSGSYNGSIKLFDTKNYKLLHTFNEAVYSVCFSPDGKQILSGSDDNSIKLFDAKNYKLLHTFNEHTNIVLSVCFSPDGKQILSGSFDNSIKLFDAKNYKLLHTFNEHKNWVLSVCFSPDSKQILSSSDDNSIKLFDAKNYKLLHTFKQHKNWVNSVCFSPDGKQILSGSNDSSIKLFDAKNYKLLHTFKQHKNWVNSVCFSPDGKQILSGSNDSSIKLFDAKNYKLLHTFNEHKNWVFSVCFSPDGKQILSGSNDNSIKLFDAKNYKLLLDIVFYDNAFISYKHLTKTIAHSQNLHKLKVYKRPYGVNIDDEIKPLEVFFPELLEQRI